MNVSLQEPYTLLFILFIITLSNPHTSHPGLGL
jgi:hypothetical protein